MCTARTRLHIEFGIHWTRKVASRRCWYKVIFVEDNKLAQKDTYTPDSAKANMVEHAGSSSRFNSKGNKKDKRKNDKKGKGKSEYLAPKAGIVKQKFQGTCYNCDQPGHRAANCKMPKRVNPRQANMVLTTVVGGFDTGANRMCVLIRGKEMLFEDESRKELKLTNVLYVLEIRKNLTRDKIKPNNEEEVRNQEEAKKGKRNEKSFDRILFLLMVEMIDPTCYQKKHSGTRPELAMQLVRLRHLLLSRDTVHALWISDIKDSRSTSGYVFTLGGVAISWKSSKQTIIAKSTMESEFIALDKCREEA
ncbi:peroxidase 9 [Tanacetum coccineum]